jgi:hypothetical protein
MMNEKRENSSKGDSYVRSFLESPVYVMVFRDTIKTAAASYRVARILSVVLFSVGVLLVMVSLGVGIFRNDGILALILGGLGTANIFALLLYKPVERIQSGVDSLIKSQISCLSFMAQYDSISRVLTTMSEMPLKETNRDEQLKLVQYLKESSSQLMSDLREGNAK